MKSQLASRIRTTYKASGGRIFRHLRPRLTASAVACSTFALTALQATTLLNPEPEDSTTHFGKGIAVIGDINSDGVPDLAVGAPFEDGDFVNSDAGFGPPQNVGKVFILSGANLSVITRLNDPEFQMIQPQKFGGQFGTTVAAAGDVNGDGVPDVLVGAPHHVVNLVDEKIFSSGRVFVLSGNSDTVLLTLDPPASEENARAGLSVAGLGDINSDGKPDFVVGSPGKNIGFGEGAKPDVGVAYFYSGANGSLIRTMSDPDQQADARVGFSVANAGDVDGDGVADAIVGAPGKATAFVWSGKTGALLFTIRSPDREKMNSFGSAVAGGKDLDGDGKPDFVIGSPSLRNSQGGVYVFKGSDGKLLRRLRIGGLQNFAKAGSSVAAINDITGDGRADIMVGVPEQDVNGLKNAGQVLVFDGRNGRLFQTLTSETPQAFANFGLTMAAADFDGNGTPTPIIGVPFQNAELIDPDDGDKVTHLQIGQIELQ
jgi:FG-GAP repeat